MAILTSTPTATLVSDADHLELMRLVQEFAWRIDHLKAATVVEIVTEDAELRTDPDNPVIGYDAIKAWGESFDVALLDSPAYYGSVVLPVDLLAPHTTAGLASQILVRAGSDVDTDDVWPATAVAARLAMRRRPIDAIASVT